MKVETSTYIINTDDNTVVNKYTGKKLIITKTQSGYLMFSGGKKIHRHVLEYTFIGPHRQTDECDHIDGNIYNNNPNNLQWLPKGQNNSLLYKHFYNHFDKELSDEKLLNLYKKIQSELISRNLL